MIWFFVAVTLIAILAWIVRNADRGWEFAEAFGFAAVMALVFFLASPLVFIFAFIFGATIREIQEIDAGPESPFGNDQLPDQIVPPSRPDT